MNKRLISILLALMLVLSVGARSLVLQLTDGTKVYYLLNGTTNPTIRFANGQLLIQQDGYALEGVSKFYISESDDPNTAVESVIMDQQNLQHHDGVIYAKTCTLRVYTPAGRAVSAPVQVVGDVRAVNLQSLPGGTYIIQMDNRSLKIVKR